ncbi:MAG: c-type cytochrome [Opitutaceae bacterium]|nr:c-type cytochrome [Opitutaceae bacterium]
MKKINVIIVGVAALLAAPLFHAAEAKKSPRNETQIKRGEHLVKAGLCADCHTPKKLGPNGPEEDHSLMLSGHPAGSALPPPPKLASGPWQIITDGGLTAWSGPWGVTFARNLTPDKETGLGDWTEQNFVDTIRTGKKMGKGRALLPPMPVEGINNYTTDELKAIFAYLRSLPPIKNAVPEPIPPTPAASQ